MVMEGSRTGINRGAARDIWYLVAKDYILCSPQVGNLCYQRL